MREMANVTVAIDSDSLQNQEDSGSLDSSSSSSRSINNGVVGGVISITPPESPALGYNNNSNKAHHHNSKSASAAVKFKLLLEGDVQVCRLNHTRTIISKIMNSRYLRRWESQHLVLGDSDIRTAEQPSCLEESIPYATIEDVNIISRWDAGHKFCIRITVPDGSVLLQASNAYLRDQWLHSIQWKRNVLKYDKLLRNTRRPEVLVKEIKNLVDMALNTSIQDESVSQFPLDLVSQVLQENDDVISQAAHEQIIVALAPLLEKNRPTQEICNFFSKHCQNSPRSQIVIELFTPVVYRILKHNTDFGKCAHARMFIQEYIQAISARNDGQRIVETFVRNVHGQASCCPHPRVLSNLVAVSLAGIYNCFEERKRRANFINLQKNLPDLDERLQVYLTGLHVMCEYDDWRPALASLLQPIPFPDEALVHPIFVSLMRKPLMLIADDVRCEVHLSVMGIREGKEGWFHLYCPGGLMCYDEGHLFGVMIKRLMSCCCRRKKFLQAVQKQVSPCMLLALRDNAAAMDVLCAMLEFDIIESSDVKMQIITTLQTTPEGKHMYTQLCNFQIALRELQQKGGPRKLTLPSKSTDADLTRLLSSGSFGNLEYLSLAFTQVTSACARELIKLPALRSLNLWSTQFGDSGLQLLSEHLSRLQVLNLCETPVTDKGLKCLSSMKNLRKLNLNSTQLSALTFEGLKETLPGLQECDVRYTDAW